MFFYNISSRLLTLTVVRVFRQFYASCVGAPKNGCVILGTKTSDQTRQTHVCMCVRLLLFLYKVGMEKHNIKHPINQRARDEKSVPVRALDIIGENKREREIIQ